MKHLNRLTFLMVVVLLLVASCKCKKEKAITNVEKVEDSLSVYTFKKIDIHTHYRYVKPYLMAVLDDFNMDAALIDIVKDNEKRKNRYWTQYKAVHTQYPDRFYLCTSFNAFKIDEPDYAKNVIDSLQKTIDQGARMVKVWKNFGMVDKDKSGKFVQIDDVRLQPVWDYLAKKNIPVIAHIGEPIQAWMPIDTLNPHSGYFKSNPKYHAYLHPGKIPHYDEIIAARDNWLEKNPKLTVLGAHLGSTEHDVDLISERLDKYPNFYVETGARFGDLVRQDSRKVVAFFNKYQDRIMYGTDLGNRRPHYGDSRERTIKNMNQMITMQWKYLATGDSINYDSPNLPNVYKTKGLKLSKEVLQKVYHDNAAKLLKIQ